MSEVTHPSKRKTNLTLPRTAGFTLTILGLTALALAIIYSSPVPAFIGLGLTFWGIILTYIKTEDYVKKPIMDATATSLLTTLNQTLQELDYKGKAIYLPPKYLNDPAAAKAYIPKSRTGKLPSPEQTQELENCPLPRNPYPPRNPYGILITPPGADLTKLFEQTLGTSFARTSLENLQRNLPKLLIEDLEIATDIDIQLVQSKTTTEIGQNLKLIDIGYDKILTKITSPANEAISKQVQELPHIYASIGCPLTSAVACAIAKATGKPTIIETQKTSNDNQTIETEYRLLKEEPP